MESKCNGLFVGVLSLAGFFGSLSKCEAFGTSPAPLRKVLFGDNSDSQRNCNFLCFHVPGPDENIETTFGTPTQSKLPASFKVLVWNVYKGRKENWHEDFSRVAPSLDLALIQEIKLDDPMKEALLSMNGAEWVMGTSFFMKDMIRTGDGIGSRVKPVSSEVLRTPDLEPFVKSPKLTIFTEYPIENSTETLLVATLHAINFRKTEGMVHQVQQAQEVIRAHRGPVLYAGDFNTKNDSRLTVLDQMTSEVGLSRVPIEDEPESRKTPLDHAYIRGLKVNQARIVSELISSDHPAIELDLSYAP